MTNVCLEVERNARYWAFIVAQSKSRLRNLRFEPSKHIPMQVEIE